jgi:hypothetical protein
MQRVVGMEQPSRRHKPFNKANFTMDQLCEQGTPVPMFATGKAFPVRFYDPDLSATEQGILVGMYRYRATGTGCL